MLAQHYIQVYSEIETTLLTYTNDNFKRNSVYPVSDSILWILQLTQVNTYWHFKRIIFFIYLKL